MPALQIHNDPIANIQPIAEKRINGHISQFIYWLGRLINMLSMRYSMAAGGGADKVATTFQTTINDTVTWSQTHRRQGEHTVADDALFDLAYDMTLMNKSQLDALAPKLEARADQLENDALLATLKRSEMMARLPAITQSIRNVLARFEEKVRASRPAQIVPDVVVEAAPAPAPVPEAAAPAPAPEPVEGAPLEARSPQAQLDKDMARAARYSMATPTERHNNTTGIKPTLNAEKLVVADFRRSLEVRLPDFSAVTALGEHLDHHTGPQAQKLLAKLSLMAQLYLYEVTNKHQDLLVSMMAEHHTILLSNGTLEADEMKEKFRAYLTIHKRNPLVNGRYVALLDKIKKPE